jgi:hypothetical protein
LRHSIAAGTQRMGLLSRVPTNSKLLTNSVLDEGGRGDENATPASVGAGTKPWLVGSVDRIRWWWRSGT